MIKKTIGFFVLIIKMTFVYAVLLTGIYSQTSSIYKYIDDKNCREEKDVDYTIFYSAVCKGIGGYEIGYSEGEDYHQFLNLLSADGKYLGIDVTKISIAAATVGKTLEWRVVKQGKSIKPFALIFRFTVFRHGISEPDQAESLLVIAKITKDSVCITDTVKPNVKNQNKQARKLADISRKKPCFGQTEADK